MVPHLTTALAGPLQDLEQRVLQRMPDIERWLLDPYFTSCGEINFQERSGEECLASNVAMVLHRIGGKYEDYGIEEKPFVIVKADAGTYGMGIMTVRDAAEVMAARPTASTRTAWSRGSRSSPRRSRSSS